MDNVCIFSLEYSFVIDPKLIGYESHFETNGALWKQFIDNDQIYQMVDNLVLLQELVELINSNDTEGNYITIVKPQVNNPLITISIYGNPDFITESKSKILSNYNQIDTKTIQLSAVDANLIPYMYEICQKYNIEMVINNYPSLEIENYKLNIQSDYFIHIIGNVDNITLGETAMRVLIDSVVYNYFIDSITIDLSLIPIIGGVDLFNFNQIARQTKANIYIPDLLPNCHSSQTIFITAKNIPEILLTKNIINNLIKQNSIFYTKSIDILKTKLNLLSLHNQAQILNLMFNFGVFIKLPHLGDSNQTITIQGSCEESVNNAMDELNLLFSNYYTISVHKKPTATTNNNILYHLLHGKTCNISSTKYGIEISGNSQEIKQIIPYLSCLKDSYLAINLRLELANSQQDFISGKKNGKLTKILNQLNHLPTIKFKNYHDYNFFIDFEIKEKIDISYMTKGLDLIELELPSELHFNVPEVFHKSIIGNGGSIIQSIMKKYNVFIKFSSFNNGNAIKNVYSFTRFNNVLIKCPRKNAGNIQLVKYEIDQLVQQCCQLTTSPNYSSRFFKLMKADYLLLINNNKLRLIQEMEVEYNCFMNFPTSLDDFKGKNHIIMGIKGNEGKIDACIEKLASIILKKYEFKLTYNLNKFRQYLTADNEELNNQIVIPFKLKLGIELSIQENEEYHSIIINYHQPESLPVAIQNLTIYLRDKGFLIIDKKSFASEPVDIKLPLNPITNRVNHCKNQKLNSAPDLMPMTQTMIPKGIW